VDFGKHGAAKLGSATLRTKNGTTTYLLRDIATVMDRLEDYNFDRLIYVVGDQEVHFRWASKMVEMLGWPDVAD
jgi:arginyl-tRNA synthetase